MWEMMCNFLSLYNKEETCVLSWFYGSNDREIRFGLLWGFVYEIFCELGLVLWGLFRKFLSNYFWDFEVEMGVDIGFGFGVEICGCEWS